MLVYVSSFPIPSWILGSKLSFMAMLTQYFREWLDTLVWYFLIQGSKTQ